VAGRTKNDDRLGRPSRRLAAAREETVTFVQPRPGDLAAKNREFVPKHDNFELLELARAQPQRPPLQAHAENSQS
jgi:hypothetical protein